MKNTNYALAIVIILGISLFIAGCSTTEKKQVGKVPFNGETETVKLSVDEDGFYEPRTITVKAGTKVRIEADPDTVSGYMDTIVIDDYGVEKKITTRDTILEFVADMPGTYAVHCANGMGDGKLIVTP